MKLVQQIKDKIRNLKPLELHPLGSYLIIEFDGRLRDWGAVLKYRPTIFSSIKEEKKRKYDSGTYQIKVTAIDVEIIATIKVME